MSNDPPRIPITVADGRTFQLLLRSNLSLEVVAILAGLSPEEVRRRIGVADKHDGEGGRGMVG